MKNLLESQIQADSPPSMMDEIRVLAAQSPLTVGCNKMIGHAHFIFALIKVNVSLISSHIKMDMVEIL